MNREYHKWYSPGLQRDMELLVFGNGGRAVLFFPTRKARFFDYENWGIVDALSDKINNGELQLFCVDSIDAESLYNHHISPEDRILRHLQYEKYILKEVLPLMRTKNQEECFEVAGCSMGAYHAANITLRYPWLFKKVVCMSGRFDLTKQVQDFLDLFDGYTNRDIFYNTPNQYLAGQLDKRLLNDIKKIEIILAVGETDPFLASNKEFSRLLTEKGIKSQFYIWDDYAHRARYWKQMVQLYL